jgi:predicted ATPase
MSHDYQRFIIISGGPGSGKSTLIDALEKQGFARSVEAGRAIIQHQVEISGKALPWADRALFAELMLSWEMRSYDLASNNEGPVFFDRGVPDVIGYLTLCGLPVPEHIRQAASTIRYNRMVFLAPPWSEIFGQDANRTSMRRNAHLMRWSRHISSLDMKSRSCRNQRFRSAQILFSKTYRQTSSDGSFS